MVPGFIDQGLGMLHAHSHGKTLGFQPAVPGQEHLIYILRGMTGCQDHFPGSVLDSLGLPGRLRWMLAVQGLYLQ